MVLSKITICSYFVAVLAIISAICIGFDSATSQWLVQKVLNELSQDVANFERDLDEFKNDLAIAETQIKQRDSQLLQSAEQIKQSAEQIKKQEVIISNIKLIQVNMSALLSSMMDAHSEGVNLNDLFRANLDKFDLLLGHMAKGTFNDMDMNKNGLIDINEFMIYVNKNQILS